MESSPADILRKYFVDLGLAIPSSPESTDPSTWPIITGAMPTSAHDNYLALMNAGAIRQGRLHVTGQRVVRPKVLIGIRSQNEAGGWEKGRSLEDVLDKIGARAPKGIGPITVTINSVAYLITAANVIGSLTRIGQEETNRRQLYTINVALTIPNYGNLR